ncbi:YnfA family protein [Thioclava nitratireducens]|uniref:YnfA family protein n=1 Tax=Thioclava nitratireducens TaxID=1915078 RepID=UPI00247FC036|nr:YnfA family protein [Thioclava nitratireducens]WGT50448.1 YnfA family protein [Thioclava nitratireducens]
MSAFASIGMYVLAALAEIAGCFAFWAWLRLDRSALWLIPGAISLALFAYLLTRVEVEFAGRAYAAYGGIYITASIAWLWAVEGQIPTRWDIIGAIFCLTGMAIILVAPMLQK